jgi:hypothetical protein
MLMPMAVELSIQNIANGNCSKPWKKRSGLVVVELCVAVVA